MQLTKDVIRKLMRSIHLTYQHELTCGECFNEIDRFAELELAGKNATEAMPLVQEHLERCEEDGYVLVRHGGIAVGLGMLHMEGREQAILHSLFPKRSRFHRS